MKQKKKIIAQSTAQGHLRDFDKFQSRTSGIQWNDDDDGATDDDRSFLDAFITLMAHNGSNLLAENSEENQKCQFRGQSSTMEMKVV